MITGVGPGLALLSNRFLLSPNVLTADDTCKELLQRILDFDSASRLSAHALAVQGGDAIAAHIDIDKQLSCSSYACASRAKWHKLVTRFLQLLLL